MSTKAYKQKGREPWGELAPRCLGTCGYDLEAALAMVAQQHPEWSERRQKQRALVEMVKRGGQR